MSPTTTKKNQKRKPMSRKPNNAATRRQAAINDALNRTIVAIKTVETSDWDGEDETAETDSILAPIELAELMLDDQIILDPTMIRRLHFAAISLVQSIYNATGQGSLGLQNEDDRAAAAKKAGGV